MPPGIDEEIVEVASEGNSPARKQSGLFVASDTKWTIDRGSHILLRRTEPPRRRSSVSNHKELAKGTLRALLRESGLTVEDFSRLL